MTKIAKSFASHYILLPDAKLGKWPIISIDENGKIVEIETRNEFIERPSLEMHPGIIIPAFVDIINEEPAEKINKNLHHAKGTLVVNNIFTIETENLYINKKHIADSIPNFLTKSNKPIIEKIIDAHRQNNSNIAEILYWATQWGAEQTDFCNKIGKLEIGYTPGIIVIQNIDLRNQLITNNATIKWLNKPYIK